ncbi:MAG: TetR/AcrR family transcriptional regulator [Alphaproteobacteria bacterium]|nr:TetR/AcrR family transcriptional regulator [Alphaproteobacteria bacterium]
MSHTALRASIIEEEDGFTPRQSAVLQSALNLLVRGGDRALTTAGVAKAANCSKESLYKWFGDRDGLLAAVISFQASKVRATTAGKAPRDADAFRDHLVRFAQDLLDVLSGDVSLALNRLAIGQAGNQDTHLGLLVLARGRRMIGQRAGALLETGRQLGFLAFGDPEEAYQTLYGLIVRDLHVRQLLGEELADTEQDFEKQAIAAIDQFFRLYGTGIKAAGTAVPASANQ